MDSLKTGWNWVVARFKEPSTWAGIAAIATAIKASLALSPDVYTALVAAGGALAIVLRESK